MKITLSLAKRVAKEVLGITAKRGASPVGIGRDYQHLIDDPASGQRHSEREALEASFVRFQFGFGERKWKRADLYDCP